MSASALLSLVLAAQKAINDLAAAVGIASNANPYGCTDDPFTSPLGPRGEWCPPFLARLSAAARAKYPDSLSEPTPDLDGHIRRKPVYWPNRLLLAVLRDREDLTEAQRAELVKVDERTFQLIMGDSGSSLLGLAEEPEGPNGAGGCLFLTPKLYNADSLDRLRTDLANWYQREVGVTVE